MNIINRVTLKVLKKNKIRTIVTIIGVILSAAMLTAVTTLVSSMQNYLVRTAIIMEGDWHTHLYGGNLEQANTLSEMEELENVFVVKSGGYAMLEGSKNGNKPYLHILELDEKAMGSLPVRLITGRLPENENEVLVSYHVFTNGGVEYKPGDKLKLDIGHRLSEGGIVLNQLSGYLHGDDGMTERLVVEQTREFTVTGICERLPYTLEEYNAPGYSIVTVLNEDKLSGEDKVDIFFKAKNIRRIYKITESIADAGYIEAYQYNRELLMYQGVSTNDVFIRVLYSLAAILILLIMIGSVSLIYNSFSISVSERKRQFGLLSGAGATSRQLKHSVLFEALVIGAVGIPLGILSGIVGIGTTLYFLKDIFASFMSISNVTLAPTLTVSAAAIIAAAVTALVTILISAFIPAHRAAKISAIEAIRQTTDIRLSGKQVRTSPIIRMLFGMEGNLAVKNFRRNKRRYRSTVVSLFISIVLFVSTSAFCKYLVDGTKSVYEVKKYDIFYYTGQKKLSDSMMTAFNSILAMEEVSEGQYVKDIFVNSVIPTDKVTETFYNKSLIKGYMRDKESINVGLLICGIQHDAFVKYISDLGLDIKDFENSEILTGVLLDHQHYYDYEEKRYIDMTVFKERKPWPLPVSLYTDKDGYSEIEVYIAAYADWAPLAVDDYSNGNYTTLIVDFDMTNKFYEGIEDNWGDVTLIIKAKDPAKAEVKIKDILIDAGFDTSGLYNAAADMQSTKNIITVMMVFSYGFITLISLIAIANVFNTISTNMNLRRKEFAMLKSVGMTKSGFNKMLNYECVFYGLKSLIYGIPVALLFTWMIFKSLRQGVDIAFQLPVSSILTSVLSVFIVVFVTMIYSMRKIRNENILDALKCENL